VVAVGELLVDQSLVGLVHLRRGVQRLAGPLLRQLLGGEFAQLVVDQRQQLLPSFGVAGLDGGQYQRDVGHDADDTSAGEKSRSETGHPSTRPTTC
jgi:hypothetical protein